tara:strand:- start:360 stop:548 length:189 start_codon:yes stop_codon:yes gene_type:complete
MQRLITILYACAAGLEQACVTFETIKQAHKAALVMAARNVPPAKGPIGFHKNTPVPFTAEDS